MATDWPQTRATLLRKLRDPAKYLEAWRDFYNLYWTPIYHLCRARGMSKEDAEDLTGDCILKAMQEIVEGRFEYDPNRKYRSWLGTVVRNSCENLRKSFSQRQRGSGSEEVQRLLDGLPSELERRAHELDEKLAQEEAIEKVRQEYSPAEWEAFILAQSGQLKKAEAAARLGKPVGAFWAFTMRVRRKIRERWEELGDK